MKVLIVDDSAFSRATSGNLIKEFLGEADIFFANDGQDGFEVYKRIKPHYTFVDLLMPNINGQDMIKLIKEYNSSAKIFVISADVQKYVKEEIAQYNIMAFINKPFNEEKAKMVCDIIREDFK
ncbi:response regulator transcription factor [Cellulosilyticum sp. I15G10I2]|uniref:response regulator transcription factor n=1 Tax=Cellulosilyticum sp. I15G10I2 TaxID=1892843 RepID=UPI00085BB490|nr:response regulator [Cellulosilyticum sp. I15G10I2]